MAKIANAVVAAALNDIFAGKRIAKIRLDVPARSATFDYVGGGHAVIPCPGGDRATLMAFWKQTLASFGRISKVFALVIPIDDMDRE